MNTAEQLMVVKGLIEGLTAAERDLKARLAKQATEFSVGTFKTPLGPASVSAPQPQVELDPAAFLAWCQEHHPEVVVLVPQVREWFVAEALSKLAVASEDVVDANGEVVGYARVRPAGAPVVSARLSASVKAQAREQVAGALDGLLSVLQIEAGR